MVSRGIEYPLLHEMVPRGAGMTGLSRGIEYPLLHEILHTFSKT